MVLRGGCMNEKSLTVLEQYEINLKNKGKLWVRHGKRHIYFAGI